MWSIFKKRPANINHSFDDRDRELSLERKRMNIELDNARKRNEIEEENMRHELEMARMQDELDDFLGEEEPHGMTIEDQAAMKLINAINLTPPQNASYITPQQTVSAVGVSISDEELLKMWQAMPPQAKAASKVSTDEQLSEFMKVKLMPNADTDTLQRAIKIIRTA
jgi:hypothetical protein